MKMSITRTGAQYKKVFDGLDFLKDDTNYRATFEDEDMSRLLTIVFGTFVPFFKVSKKLQFEIE